MTNDEQNDAMGRVVDYARTLGLYGVMILSPRCPDCGTCHDFGMVADAADVVDPGGAVTALLLRFAKVATRREPEFVDADRGHH